jgi:hypothetical protein
MIGYGQTPVKRFSHMYIVSARGAGQSIGRRGHVRRTARVAKIKDLANGTNFAYSTANFAAIVSADFIGPLYVWAVPDGDVNMRGPMTGGPPSSA